MVRNHPYGKTSPLLSSPIVHYLGKYFAKNVEPCGPWKGPSCRKGRARLAQVPCPPQLGRKYLHGRKVQEQTGKGRGKMLDAPKDVYERQGIDLSVFLGNNSALCGNLRLKDRPVSHNRKKKKCGHF